MTKEKPNHLIDRVTFGTAQTNQGYHMMAQAIYLGDGTYTPALARQERPRDAARRTKCQEIADKMAHQKFKLPDHRWLKRLMPCASSLTAACEMYFQRRCRQRGAGTGEKAYLPLTWPAAPLTWPALPHLPPAVTVDSAPVAVLLVSPGHRHDYRREIKHPFRLQFVKD